MPSRPAPIQQVLRPSAHPAEPALHTPPPAAPPEAATARRPYDIDIPATPPQRLPQPTPQPAERPSGGFPVDTAAVRIPDPPAPPQAPAAQPVITRSPGASAVRPYSGPRAGVVNWSGQIEKGGTVTLDGKLPGVPVMVDIDTREFAIVEAPSPANGWNRVVVRSKNKRHTVISLQWTVL